MIASPATSIPTEGHEMDNRWWALVIAFIGAACVVLQNNVVLSDPDTLWHIASGRLMWETGAFPLVDTMSHTYAGRPWIAKEWLSQVLLFAAYALGGWAAVHLLAALSVAVCIGIIALRLLKTFPPLLAVLVAWIMINCLLGITSARPHVLALPVIALFTTMLLNAAEGERTPPWLALPVLALWANLHAAFTLGFIIAALLALDAILRAERREWPRLVALWFLFGLGCLAVTCIHPYGWQSLLINIDMARGNESVPLIGEWEQHPILAPIGFRLVVPALMLATLVLGGWRNAARIALGTFAVYLTWKHQRFVMLLAILAPMLSRDTLLTAITALCDRFRIFQQSDPMADPKWRVPAAIACVSGLLTLPILLDRPQPPPETSPVAALRSVPPELLGQPVYNSYNYGGFLILNGVRTFMDGRTDQLFTDNFMGRLFAYLKKGDEAAFLAFIERYNPRWAIVQQGHDDLKAISKSPHWREHFSDEHSKVFIRVDG